MDHLYNHNLGEFSLIDRIDSVRDSFQVLLERQVVLLEKTIRKASRATWKNYQKGKLCYLKKLS